MKDIKFLIIGPAWVGDMVLAQSLFRLLKQRHPDARLDVVAPAWTLPLLARMPEVDEAIPAPFKHGELALGARMRLGRSLRARDYDRAIVLPNSFKSALVPCAARARRRTGFVGELRYGLLNDIRRLEAGAEPPAVPEPRLEADAANARAALARLGRGLPQTPVLGLCPGAEYGPAKRWPVEYFAEVATAKLAAGWEVWLFGSDKDAPITAAIQSRVGGGCLDLAGKTTLADAIDLLALTAAVVSNDSGLMHVAAALGRRLVALYGSSDPRHTPPMGGGADVLYLGLECSPCFKRECPLGHLRCLREIMPRRVLETLAAFSGKIQDTRYK